MEQFYTPEYIVQYMLDYLLINRLIKIVDPACGTGSFLLPIIAKLALTEAEVDSVYGFDLDNEAIEVLKAILHLQGKRFKNEHLIHGNTIVESKEISPNALNLKDLVQKRDLMS
ncbi:N-6 DNA methylase [Anaerobacillus sp. HL2]|nr:N-6 DNA methylase [Anaerobacillus sp. HL2]